MLLVPIALKRKSIRRTSSLLYALAATIFIPAHSVFAQYYNTDGGRPGRVEDATPTERRSIDIDFTGIQFEKTKSGISRFRFDPGVSWGVLPRTEIGFRFPFARVKPPASTKNPGASGLAGIAAGGMYALTAEAPQMPAIAIATEVLLPVGRLSSPQASYVVKAITTKRFGFGRLHANVGAGTYSVKIGGALSVDSSCVATNAPSDSCGQPPIIIDLPCNVFPAVTATASSTSRSMCGMNRQQVGDYTASASRAAVIASPKSSGTRWFAGLGVDHAFALNSTLISADIVFEKFEGLFPAIDQTLEAGVRHQLTPIAMIDAGLSWRYAGTVPSVSFTFGTTLGFAWPLLHGGAPRAKAK